jgi:hypothetical protein
MTSSLGKVSECVDFRGGIHHLLDGGRGRMLDEPLATVSYLSVFIPHFIGNPSENHEILRKLYLYFDLSSYQIAEITGWSRPAISDFFRRENITKDVRKSPSPKFGERTVGGLRILHQAEQKIIQKIVKLKTSGASFREIAKVLNQNGIPTKRGGQWSKTTIQDIYKREQEKEK